jgi:hypothetical protein
VWSAAPQRTGHNTWGYYDKSIVFEDDALTAHENPSGLKIPKSFLQKAKKDVSLFRLTHLHSFRTFFVSLREQMSKTSAEAICTLMNESGAITLWDMIIVSLYGVLGPNFFAGFKDKYTVTLILFQG